MAEHKAVLGYGTELVFDGAILYLQHQLKGTEERDESAKVNRSKFTNVKNHTLLGSNPVFLGSLGGVFTWNMS